MYSIPVALSSSYLTCINLLVRQQLQQILQMQQWPTRLSSFPQSFTLLPRGISMTALNKLGASPPAAVKEMLSEAKERWQSCLAFGYETQKSEMQSNSLQAKNAVP